MQCCSTYYPYKSEAARDFCLAHLDSFAATHWPVAAEERKVPTPFGATFVRLAGPPDAPPLVLLHGATGTSLMWAPNIQALSAEYRTIAVDQIGEFGKSACDKPVESFNDLLVWLNGLFDALNLTRGIRLVGISYGGALAAQYALHFPGKLDKVVLLAPGNTILKTSLAFWTHFLPVVISRQKGMASFLRWIFADMVRKDPEWVAETIELLHMNMQNLVRRKWVIPPVMTDAEWQSLKLPVLFLIGENDRIYSARKAVDRLNRVAPAITAEIIPGAGHDFTVAHAAEVNQRILEFLSKTDTSATARRSCQAAALSAGSYVD